MMRSRILGAVLSALIAFSTFPVTTLADEGMWTFNNIPRSEIKRRYGFDITDEWLRKAQLAVVRFPNGTGSFVSPEGLVLTNYHIIEEAVGALSTAEKDYAKTGFVAQSRDQELPIKGMELNQLVSIEDITARVTGAIREGVSVAESAAARQAEISRIEKESTEKTGFKSEVVTLYQGGLYNLYRYRKFSDVRLVFAPEFQTAFFGGDPDNFNFPRYNLDMGIVRVYENGKPYNPESYFKWSVAGAKEGDLTFVVGSPGTTQRLNTVAHLEFLRDHGIIHILRGLESRRDSLKTFMAKGEEETRRGQSELNYAENFIKVFKGQIEGLKEPALLQRKQRDEQALRDFVNADPRRKKEYGDAWDAIANARRSLATYERERRVLGGMSLADTGTAFNSPLFMYARALVRLAAESEKPSAERLPEYTDARRAATENAIFSTAPIYDDFEQMKLAASLALMRSTYGPTHSLVQKVLAGKTPEARAAELISGTRLKEVEYRRQLAKGGKRAIDESTDSFILLAKSVDPESREVRKRYESEVVGVERTAYAKIARARFEKEGTGVYPDATFTPRVSYGAVKGYKERGRNIVPFTDIGGLYSRSAYYKEKFPYNLPSIWAEKKSALNPKTPYNFVTTNDIIGGNSGSPTFNKDLELVGLIFDGNIQSIVGSFYYDEEVNRAISVDSRGMLEVLRKVYGGNKIAAELTGTAAREQSQRSGR
jgi:hypothetical protein